jgi:glycosyltransferase involved in cell wall biosynthesis
MVVTVHDMIALYGSKNRTGTLDTHHRTLRAYWRTVIPRAARASQLIVTSSDFALTDIAATLKLPRSKFRVAFIAVGRSFNATAEGARPAAITAHDQFVMSFAATDGRKNHPTTMESFRRVREEFPELKLVLVCSHQNMREQLLESPEERVLPVGPVSLTELVWLYRNAQVMVFPSLDEGFGLPPVEALACGTPVIASNSGSLPEVLGQAAQLTDPKDVEGIAGNMRRILLDPALRKTLSSQGLEHAKEFTHEAMGRTLVEVYREASAAERRGSP